jgi:hypothetical protein
VVPGSRPGTPVAVALCLACAAWCEVQAMQLSGPQQERSLIDPLSAPRVHVLMFVPKMVRKEDFFPVARLLG